MYHLIEGDSLDLAITISPTHDGGVSLTSSNPYLTDENLPNSTEDMDMRANGLLISASNEFECINIISDEEICDQGVCTFLGSKRAHARPEYSYYTSTLIFQSTENTDIEILDDIDIGDLITSLGGEKSLDNTSDIDATALAGNDADQGKHTSDNANSEVTSKYSDLTVSIAIDKLMHNASRKPLHPSTETAKLLDKIRKRNHLIQQKRSSLGSVPKISKIESLAHRERSQSLSGLSESIRMQANIPKLVIRKLNKSSANESSETVDGAQEFLRPASTFQSNRSERWSRSSDSSYGMSKLSLMTSRKCSFDASLTDAEQDAFPDSNGIKIEVDADAPVSKADWPTVRRMVDASTQTSSSLLCKCVRERISRSRRFLEERALQQLKMEIRKTIEHINELGFGKPAALYQHVANFQQN